LETWNTTHHVTSSKEVSSVLAGLFVSKQDYVKTTQTIFTNSMRRWHMGQGRRDLNFGGKSRSGSRTCLLMFE